MSKIISNFENIQNKINKFSSSRKPKVIAVSKTFSLSHIMPLVEYGHVDYGENKVQEALSKWSNLRSENKNIKLHMIGKLQSNKAKKAVEIFDFIHSVDSQKLADTLAKSEKSLGKKISYFIQVNIGSETQKSGIGVSEVDQFYYYCVKELGINILGLMAIPPNDNNTDDYFKTISELNRSLELPELSLGMSADYEIALKYNATYLRIGSSIFGERG